MAELVLVRHGQANNAATNEADYDRLSSLGRRQSEWLGDWLRHTEAAFDAALSGTLTRHLHTAEAMGVETTPDARWNELSYHPLAAAYAKAHGAAPPAAPEDFADYFAGLLDAWRDRTLVEEPESFANFHDRVHDAMEDVRGGGGRTLVVTSGGVIGLLAATAMELDMRGTARLIAGIGNTAVQRLFWNGRRWVLAEYGATPHLAPASRAHARTYY